MHEQGYWGDMQLEKFDQKGLKASDYEINGNKAHLMFATHCKDCLLIEDLTQDRVSVKDDFQFFSKDFNHKIPLKDVSMMASDFEEEFDSKKQDGYRIVIYGPLLAHNFDAKIETNVMPEIRGYAPLKRVV
jgi:hypothetical protein